MYRCSRERLSRFITRLGWLAVVHFFFLGSAFSAELPELDSSSTRNWAATSARFFGGATRDSALTFADSFQSHESIDVTAEIRFEPGHIGMQGDVYIVAELNGQIFMRVSDGRYLPWDLQISSLQAAISTQSLAASQSVSILSQASLGQFDLAAAQLNFYLAYRVNNSTEELFYSNVPLRVCCNRRATQNNRLYPTRLNRR